MKRFVALLFVCGSITALAQAPYDTGVSTSLADGFFRGDYFNASAFVDGAYDSTQQVVNSPNAGGPGFAVGGSVTGTKKFSDSSLSLTYRGEYRDYSGSFGGTGTNQNLNFAYTKRLGRRWNFIFQTNAATILYGSQYYSFNPSQPPLNNPLSNSTRFLQSTIGFTYRQTQRLTYDFTGSFFLNRYSYAGATGVTGGIFSGSATYQLSARTSFGGTYSHDEMRYQFGAGSSTVDGFFGTLSHRFGQTWLAHVSAGASRVSTAGEYRIPVSIVVDGQTITGIEIIPYNIQTVIPTVQAGLDKHLRAFDFGANFSHGVSAGNGSYLTSTNTSYLGHLSRNFGRVSSLTVSGGHAQLSSVAKAVQQGYSQDTFTAYYSRLVYSHVSAYGGYSFYRYGGLLGFGARNDNRFVFGISFSTKNVPLTLF